MSSEDKPKGITYGQISRLSVDDKQRLLWDGKPVVTREKVLLGWWVNGAIIIGGIGALLQGIMSLLAYISEK